MLELKDFVQQTLVQIMEGVAEAQTKNKSGGNISPGRKGSPAKIHKVRFDVAITEGLTDTGKGKAGIFVAFANAGVEGAVEEYSSTYNRIKFGVPVVYPRLSDR